jgi:hypothetical protein
MDILYVAILIAFYVLISALALGCDRLQKRRGGTRPRSTATPAVPATSPNTLLG